MDDIILFIIASGVFLGALFVGRPSGATESMAIQSDEFRRPSAGYLPMLLIGVIVVVLLLGLA
jgi:hypothetical protein